MRVLISGACLLCVAISLIACSTSNHIPHERWAITAADSGGITGMENGFTMIESGGVFLWSGLRGTEETHTRLGEISRELAQYMEDSIAVNLRESSAEYADMPDTGFQHIHYLELEVGGIRTRATWGTVKHPQPPTRLKFWYENFVRACERME